MSDLVQPELVKRLERLSDDLITEFGPSSLIRNCSVVMLEAAQAIQQVLDSESGTEIKKVFDHIKKQGLDA